MEKIRKKMKNGRVCLMDLAGNKGVKKYLKWERKGIKTACLNEIKIEEEARWDGFFRGDNKSSLKKGR